MVCTTHEATPWNEWVKEQVISQLGFGASISLLVNGLTPRKVGNCYAQLRTQVIYSFFVDILDQF